MLNGLDLFSGIGGLSLALAPWVRPITYCENDRYAQSVLLARMADGLLVNAPIWDDVRTLSGKCLPQVDLVYGGFPCQDVSTAGVRKGLDGERTGLFREAIRLVSECKPQFVFFENVQGIRKFVHVVRGELETLGYNCRDGFLSARDIGAGHERCRWWLLAHSSDTTSERPSRLEQYQKTQTEVSKNFDLVLPKIRSEGISQFYRTDHGLPIPVDEIRALGNAVVPLQARKAFEILSGIGGSIE